MSTGPFESAETATVSTSISEQPTPALTEYAQVPSFEKEEQVEQAKPSQPQLVKTSNSQQLILKLTLAVLVIYLLYLVMHKSSFSGLDPNRPSVYSNPVGGSAEGDEYGYDSMKYIPPGKGCGTTFDSPYFGVSPNPMTDKRFDPKYMRPKAIHDIKQVHLNRKLNV